MRLPQRHSLAILARVIAVLEGDAERSVVSEFFELFKTPWQFYHDDLRCNVLICSQNHFCNSSAQLVLIYGSEEGNFDRQNKIKIQSKRSNCVLCYEGDRIPILGNCLTFEDSHGFALADELTGAPVALGFETAGQKVLRLGFDLFSEVRHLLTDGQPIANARIPTLELHIALLRNLIVDSSIPLVEIPPVPAGYSFIVCLTHDVDHAGLRNHKFDHTMFGFLYRATIGSLIGFCMRRRSFKELVANWVAALSLPFIYMGWAKDVWNRFDRYLDFEKGVTSTFFIIPNKMDAGEGSKGPAPRRRATRYDVSDVSDQIRRLTSAGCEIGVHGIDAWRDPAKGRAERNRIQSVTGNPEIGVRMHWLYFDRNSPKTLESAGFSYDSTVGYNEAIGYRAGVTQVFKPLQAEQLLELPMHIMDTALFYPGHMHLSPRQIGSTIEPLLENAVRFGGCLTVNWHDRSIAPERFWGHPYLELVNHLKADRAWFSTSTGAVSWFRKRRSATIEIIPGPDTSRVKVSLEQRCDNLPGLRLRVHNASLLTEPSVENGGGGKKSVDVYFNDSIEVKLSSVSTI